MTSVDGPLVIVCITKTVDVAVGSAFIQFFFVRFSFSLMQRGGNVHYSPFSRSRDATRWDLYSRPRPAFDDPQASGYDGVSPSRPRLSTGRPATTLSPSWPFDLERVMYDTDFYFTISRLVKLYRVARKDFPLSPLWGEIATERLAAVHLFMDSVVLSFHERFGSRRISRDSFEFFEFAWNVYQQLLSYTWFERDVGQSSPQPWVVPYPSPRPDHFRVYSEDRYDSSIAPNFHFRVGVMFVWLHDRLPMNLHFLPTLN